MNPRQAEARVIQLTKDMRAVEATAVKQRQNIIAESLTAADGLKLVKENAESLTGRVTGAIKVGRERHDENKAAFAEIRDWRKHVDMDLDAKDAFDAKLQTQIDCCQTKRWWFDVVVLGSFVPMWLCGMIVLVDTIISWLTK